MSEGNHLELIQDESGRRHRLQGRDVTAGDWLELRNGEQWIGGIYMWPRVPSARPFLVVEGEDTAIVLEPEAVLRWPD